jgi:hypothetical protein
MEGMAGVIVDVDLVNPHQEPCLSCGEETAIGSIYFSDRHEATGPDGQKVFLCSDCLARWRSRATGESMSDRHVLQAILAGVQMGGMGGLGS